MDTHTSRKKIMEEIQEHQLNKKLNAAELNNLFDNYLGDSLYACVFNHHLQVVKDDEIRDFIEYSLHLSNKHLKQLKEIYSKENISTPVGFGEQDVRKDAPQLFSDLLVFYITEMTRTGMMTYSGAYTSLVRLDIVKYEINNLQLNINTNILGKALMMASSQIASSKDCWLEEPSTAADRNKLSKMPSGNRQ